MSEVSDDRKKILSLTDGRGNKVEYSYDTHDRLVYVLSTNEDDISEVTYSYGDTNEGPLAADALVRVHVADVGTILRVEYDIQSRISKVSGLDQQTIEYSYDDLGLLIKTNPVTGVTEKSNLIFMDVSRKPRNQWGISTVEYGTNGKWSKRINEAGYAAQAEYSSGFLHKLIDYDGSVQTFYWGSSGELYTSESPRGAATFYDYDEDTRTATVKLVVTRVRSKQHDTLRPAKRKRSSTGTRLLSKSFLTHMTELSLKLFLTLLETWRKMLHFRSPQTGFQLDTLTKILQ